jgi:hypothetical protein
MLADTLVSKWKKTLDLSDHIFTWTEPWNLAYCAEVASRSKVMIECGTYLGRSAKVMLDAGVGHLWCIDKWSMIESGIFSQCKLFLKKEISAGTVELINGDSMLGGGMLQHMKGKVDAIFVDDGHATVDLQRDIDSLFPLLKNGGEMFGHDWEGTNDVALGVMSRFSDARIKLPVPRMWSVTR